MFNNLQFERYAYSKILTLKRNKSPAPPAVEADDIQTELKNLQRKYNHMLASTAKLRADIIGLVEANKTMAQEEVFFQYNFSQRARFLLFTLVMQSRYYNADTETSIKKLTARNRLAKPLMCDEHLASVIASGRLPEDIRQLLWISLVAKPGTLYYLNNPLKVMIRFLNDRFFKLRLESFYNQFIEYLSTGEEPVELKQHPNFKVLEEIYQSVEEYLRIVIGSYFSQKLSLLFKRYYPKHPFEFAIEEQETKGAEPDDCLSQRSLCDQLMLNQFDIMSSISFDFK